MPGGSFLGLEHAAMIKRVISLAAVGTLTALSSATALAETVCGVETHQRYGETRAYFRDVWAGCAGSGDCQMSASRIDKSQPVNISHELRFRLPKGGAQLAMELTAVSEMADISKPMKLVYGSSTLDLSGGVETRDNVVNTYHVVDAAKADVAAREMIARSRLARWYFVSDSGTPVVADLPLGGAAKALEWISCMSK